MEERGYIFNTISFDEFGNRSLPVEESVNVYGEKYQNQLVNRPVKSTLVNALGKVTIVWGAVDGALASEVRYTDLSGNIKTQSFPADLPTSVITDLKPNTTYEYRTMYKPAASIDDFYTDYAPFTLFSFDQDDWTVIDKSSNHGGGENSVDNFIDGTAATRWHTQAGAGLNYPHYATIDMGVVRTITQFALWISTFDTGPGGDSRAPEKVQFLVSMDNVTWIDKGIYDFNRFVLGKQTIVLSSAGQGRYFKFVGVSGGGDSNMVMGDISAYGF